MKPLFRIALFLLLVTNIQAQEVTQSINLTEQLELESTCEIKSRKVVHIGLLAWRAIYKELRNQKIIDYSGSIDTVSFSYTTLSNLYDGDLDKSSTGMVVFRYYLETDTSKHPKIAIGNMDDPSRYLIKMEGKDTIVCLCKDGCDLKQKFGHWEHFLEQDSSLIEIQSYNYCWNFIGSKITKECRLVIENLAHTTSPDDPRYKLPPNNKEGYIAFDIAFKYDSSHSGNISHYDFAVPCPKACPEISYKIHAPK